MVFKRFQVQWFQSDNLTVKLSSNSFFSLKKKTCNGTLTGRTPPLPLNKHVNRWFNRRQSLHLLGQRRDPLFPESAPSCQHSSSGAWDCCPCYEHTETKYSLGEAGQQSKRATEPRSHGTASRLWNKFMNTFMKPLCQLDLTMKVGGFVGWVSTPQCFYRNWDEQEGASVLPEPPESRGIFPPL